MLTFVSVDPLTLLVVVLFPYELLSVPYSNQAVVGSPLAFTVPLNVAELDVMSAAVPVVVNGAAPGV